MELHYGYTMLDADTAVCPLPAVGTGWEISGVQGNEAYFERASESMRVELPFYDGATCEAVLYSVIPPEGEPVCLWLLVPRADGRRQMHVTVVRDKGLWFALARLSPPKSGRA